MSIKCPCCWGFSFIFSDSIIEHDGVEYHYCSTGWHYFTSEFLMNFKEPVRQFIKIQSSVPDGWISDKDKLMENLRLV